MERIKYHVELPKSCSKQGNVGKTGSAVCNPILYHYPLRKLNFAPSPWRDGKGLWQAQVSFLAQAQVYAGESMGSYGIRANFPGFYKIKPMADTYKVIDRLFFIMRF
jgi:hypothetical protein